MSIQEQADVLAEKYIKARDFLKKLKDDHKDKEAKVSAVIDDLEMRMMTFLNDTGQQSSNTKSGTFFKRTTQTAKVADRDVFLTFVIDNDMRQMLESRVSSTAVAEYVQENGILPPGVDVTQVTSISVNRPKTR